MQNIWSTLCISQKLNLLLFSSFFGRIPLQWEEIYQGWLRIHTNSQKVNNIFSPKILQTRTARWCSWNLLIWLKKINRLVADLFVLTCRRWFSICFVSLDGLHWFITAWLLYQFVTLFMDQQFTLDTFETLSSQAPYTVVAISAKSSLKKSYNICNKLTGKHTQTPLLG